MVDDLFIYACIVFASIASIVLKALGSMFIRDSHPFYVVVVSLSGISHAGSAEEI